MTKRDSVEELVSEIVRDAEHKNAAAGCIFFEALTTIRSCETVEAARAIAERAICQRNGSAGSGAVLSRHDLALSIAALEWCAKELKQGPDCKNTADEMLALRQRFARGL